MIAHKRSFSTRTMLSHVVIDWGLVRTPGFHRLSTPRLFVDNYNVPQELNGFYIPEMTSVVCKSAAEMVRVMRAGNRNRAAGRTDMNEHSSRSHAVFLVTVETQHRKTDRIRWVSTMITFYICIHCTYFTFSLRHWSEERGFKITSKYIRPYD